MIPPTAEEFIGLSVVINKGDEKLVIGTVVSAIIDDNGVFVTAKIANHHIGARIQ